MQAIIDNGPPPPCPAPFNMAADVLAHARRLADRPALEIIGDEGAETWRYAELEEAVLGAATGLIRLGARPGGRVLLRLGNSVGFPVAYLACLAVDLVPVPTSPMLTAPEVSAIARELSPALIVAGEGVALPGDADCPVVAEEDLLAFRCLPPAEYRLGDPERAGYIIYTSGTSGRPRAVVHAHRALRARRMMWEGWYGLRPDDRLLHAGAFNWTFTLGTGLMDPWAIGATALIPAPGTRPEALPRLIARHRATIFAAAPGIYRKALREAAPFEAPALRHGLSAGEKLPGATRGRWRDLTGCEIHEAFGMSECSTFLSGCPARPAPEGTLGFAQRGRRIAVTDETGAPVARGEPGILAVSRGDPGLMLGYLGQAEETRARMAGEWFLTGDMVRMDSAGAVTYLGRADDMMNAGGVRVSPVEVEQALGAHPDVQDCAVAEVRLKADTSVIAAFYVSRQPLDEGALAGFAAERLARYKQPRVYSRVPELPRGANGKLLRRALRREYEETHGQA